MGRNAAVNKTLVYLIYFTIYSAVLVWIGKSSFHKGNTPGQFYLGGRQLNTVRCIMTFAGTWISAATVLGFTGSVFESGYAALFYSVIPWYIGAFLLIGISGRLYQNDILTIPELFRKRFGSKGLQLLVAGIMIFTYVLYLVIQIRGFGLVASSLFDIPYGLSILLIYLFILYATFGGFHTVTQTDAFNLITLLIGTAMVFAMVVSRAGGIFEIHRQAAELSGMAYPNILFSTDPGELLQLFGKGKFAPMMSITMFFGWGLGLAANPQYAVRIIAAKDARTSRRMIILSLVVLALLYFALLQIGLGMRVMFPSLPVVLETDEIFVYVINNLLYGSWSGFFLFAVIGACISTANSQLLIIASSFSYDIVNTLRQDSLSERALLSLSRLSILVGGTVSLLLSIHPPQSLLTYGGDIWGIFGATLFPTLYGALLYRKATAKGIWAGILTGLFGLLFFYPVYWRGILPFHAAFPATLLSGAAFLIVSKLTWPKEENDAPSH